MNKTSFWNIAVVAIAALCTFGEASAENAGPSADEAEFRALYKELIEINTTRSVGNCTRAAEAMRAHLLAAGIPPADMQILAPPEAPNDGALIAVLRGTDQIDQADPAARAYRRRRGQARGLDPRSFQAGRGERVVLRARRERRQVDGGDLHGQPDPLQEGRLQAAPRHQAGADLRRGDGRSGPVRQRALAGEDPTRSAECRVRDQRGRGRRVRQERQADRPADPGGREGLPGFRARSARSRRPQLATQAAQRDRATERGAREARRIQLSDRH